MTDLNTMTKAELAVIIGGMTPSQIKKAAHADLVQRAGEAAPKQKAAPAPAQPKPRAARVLDDRVITQSATDARHVKAVTQGSKRHLLIEALAKGATIDDLMTATGWNKDTVTSALRWDLAQCGLGVERKGGKYFLLLPKGFTRPAIVEKGQAKGEVLLAACKG